MALYQLKVTNSASIWTYHGQVLKYQMFLGRIELISSIKLATKIWPVKSWALPLEIQYQKLISHWNKYSNLWRKLILAQIRIYAENFKTLDKMKTNETKIPHK